MSRSVSFHPPRFWSGVARSGGTACVLGGTHVAITHGVIVRVPWRAGAEAEGEEEEWHITLRVIHQAAVMVMLPPPLTIVYPELGIKSAEPSA